MDNNGGSATLRVVIVGAGFGGLYAAKALMRQPISLTLIDRRNFHLFQPLLYQVATGSLSPGDIASPIRAEFTNRRNVTVLQGDVSDIDPTGQLVQLADGEQVPYDCLIVASGSRHHYFGRDSDWEPVAPGLKTVEDALAIRSKILHAFEAAESEPDEAKRRAWMTFVIVGGGPTGVEMAGTLGELAHQTLRGDYRRIRVAETRIILVETTDRLLGPYHPESSSHAQRSLEKLGVEVRTDTMVTDILEGGVTLRAGDTSEHIESQTVIWAAGVKASPMGKLLADKTGAEVDRIGRVIVQPDLRLPGYDNIFVIGDLAHAVDDSGKPLPGVAPVAMQQGNYVAKMLKARLRGKESLPPFKYFNKGSLAVIGRNQAVAEIGKVRLKGPFAWYIWAFVHIAFLIEFESRLVVLFRWAIDFLFRKRGSRLITGEALRYPRQVDPATGERET